MSNFSDYLPHIAIGISLVSLGFSVTNFFRDTARLKIRSRFIEASDYGPERIIVSMMNAGRRTVIIRLIGGSEGKKWGGTYIDYDAGGRRLGENEHFEYTFSKESVVQLMPEGDDLVFDVLWVEDSLGRRYSIPKSREHIKRLHRPAQLPISRPS